MLLSLILIIYTPIGIANALASRVPRNASNNKTQLCNKTSSIKFAFFLPCLVRHALCSYVYIPTSLVCINVGHILAYVGYQDTFTKEGYIS